MAFQIVFEAEAAAQFRSLTAQQRKTITKAIAAKLADHPTVPTRAIKRLRPNPVAEYQLSVGNLRVLYNVEGDHVVLIVIGRKAGNELIVGGEEYREHQDDPPEPSGNGIAGDPE